MPPARSGGAGCHDNLSSYEKAEFGLGDAKNLSAASDKRDVFVSASGGVRSLAKGDELVSERTAAIARRSLQERAQRDSAQSRFAFASACGRSTVEDHIEDMGGDDVAGRVRLGQEECEELEEQSRAAKRKAAELRETMSAFRAEKRQMGQREDPLDCLEWKASKEAGGAGAGGSQASSRSSGVRALLGVRRKADGRMTPGAAEDDASGASAAALAASSMTGDTSSAACSSKEVAESSASADASAAPAAVTGAADLRAAPADAHTSKSLVGYAASSDSESESQEGGDAAALQAAFQTWQPKAF
eukprot:TRINITY_DN82124_c0_g1_i1.p1 TRINITY_DN82124_c0_g1~~TRINITY_DN82124_c0_g1_i1.p1  ORF type:complete len:303 (-),score=92.25 TRINITY_DN82124_c0_g1_i1:9-917(-)